MLRTLGAGTFVQAADRRAGENPLMTDSPDTLTSIRQDAPDEATLTLADGEIHVCFDGPRQAPALVLVHGTAASLRSWDPLVPLLAGTHRIIRIDLLGCGLSAAPEGAGYTVADQARRVGEAMDRLGLAGAVLVGHSSGGVVVTALAEQRPELVAGLVLINTGPAMAAYTAPELRITPAQWADASDEHLRLLVAPAFAPGYEVPQALLDEARGMNLGVYAATSLAVHAYLDEQVLPQRLAALGKPLLVLFGEEDRRWRPSSAVEYNLVPGARIEMLPGLGHTPNYEDPPRTAAPLLAFAAGLARATRSDLR
jgi:pimeloyl-ACP methyl ester carboxylesterase